MDMIMIKFSYYIFGGAVIKGILKPLTDILGAVIKDVLVPALEALFKVLMEVFILNFMMLFINALIKMLLKVIIDFAMKILADILNVASISNDIILKNPFIGKVMEVFKEIGIGIAVLIAVWQIFKSMYAYFGFESEAAWKIGIRLITTVFFIATSDKLCQYLLDMFVSAKNLTWSAFGLTSQIDPSGNPVFDVSNFSNTFLHMDDISSYNSLDVGIELLLFIFIVMKIFGLAIKFAERYVLTMIFIMVSPLAISCATAAPTRGFFQGWVRMFFGNFVVQIMQICAFATMLLIPAGTSGGSGNMGRLANYFLVIGSITVMERIEDIVTASTINVGMGNSFVPSAFTGATNLAKSAGSMAAKVFK